MSVISEEQDGVEGSVLGIGGGRRPNRPDDGRRPLASPRAELHLPFAILLQVDLRIRMPGLEQLREVIQEHLERHRFSQH